MIKAVIFDVDGTLVDSVDLHARAWQEAFRRFGEEIPYERVRHQIGKGGDQLMPVFLSKEELGEFGEELEKYRGELFKREYLPEVKGFPGVRELFQRVKAEGLKVALASSAKGDELKTYKKLARIEDLVEEETSADDAEAAGKAGLKTIGLLSGGFPEEDLRAAGCVRIYRDAAELLADYDTSPLSKHSSP